MKRLLIAVLLFCTPFLCQADLSSWMGQDIASGGGGGTVSYVASEKNNLNASSTTVDTPVGTASGDVMIAFGGSDTDENISWPSGWTQIENVTSSSSRTASAYLILSTSPAVIPSRRRLSSRRWSLGKRSSPGLSGSVW